MANRVTAAQAGLSHLYHYEPFRPDFLFDLLRRRRIHASKIENLNDPWDCHTYFSEEGLDLRANRLEITSFLKSLERPGYQRRVLEDLYLQSIEDDEAHARDAVQRANVTYQQIAAKRWAFYCLSPHPDFNLMWSHYADKHQGICLEFSATNNALFQGALQVMYLRDYPVYRLNSSLDEQIVDTILTKSDDWRYENEFRILGRLLAGPLDARDNSTFRVHDDFFTLPSNALVAVIAGARANFDEVRTVVEMVDPSLPVKRAVLQPDQYRLAFNRRQQPLSLNRAW